MLRCADSVPRSCHLPDSSSLVPHRQLTILGIRGVPAMHGGFETFAERLALHLVQQGWRVTVYCQGTATQVPAVVEDEWRGVHRITLAVRRQGAPGTIEFDWASIRDTARRRPALALTLGYNTAVLSTYLRWRGISNLINMDGLEWKRRKWRRHARLWLWLNERVGCWTGNHLIADHPQIARHLSTRVGRAKIAMIPYGADLVGDVDPQPLRALGLDGQSYGLVIARAEPENSLLEIVRAFSRRRRGARLVVLGRYEPGSNAYHRQVLAAASEEVDFPGAIYDLDALRALRRYARFYAHGHTVGGTNPSLVEALGAANAVIAHDNPFNRWVAQDGARYFRSETECDMHMSVLLADDATLQVMRASSLQRFQREFRWSAILTQYQALLESHLQAPAQAAAAPLALAQAMPVKRGREG